MQSKTSLLLISLFVTISMAFIPSEIVYQDDFEGHLHTTKLKRDYQVWESGALLDIFLENEIINSGENALGVEIISPNPVNESRYGSVYRTLELFQGNWSGGVGVRFWVRNPNETALQLSFNFKERHREYWAVADEGIFYLQNNEGLVSQQEIFYSNLPIPPDFTGFVVIPFESFAVPSWNTAIPNQVLDLNRIESYAFSVMADENTSIFFYIDDFEVIGQTSFYKILIEGGAHVQIPPSGELLEAYSADVMTMDGQVVENTSVQWTIEEPYDPEIRISEEGIMQIPAETQPGEIILNAAWRTSELILTNSFSVTLTGENSTEESLTPAPSATPPAQTQNSAYDRVSTQFDVWTSENRPLFVGLLVLGVTGFLSVLSTIEHKLK